MTVRNQGSPGTLFVPGKAGRGDDAAPAARSGKVGLWTWEAGRPSPEWSPDLFEISGLPSTGPAPTIGEYLERVAPADREVLRRVYDEAAAGQCPRAELRYRYSPPVGGERELELVTLPDPFGGSPSARTLGVVRPLADVAPDSRSIQFDEWFRIAFADAPIGMAMLSAHGRLLMVNGALCETLGYAEDELLPRSLGQLLHAADAAQIESELQQLFAGTLDVISGERRFFHRDGRLVPAAVTISAAHDDRDTVLHAVMHIRPDGERQRAIELSEFLADAAQALAMSLDVASILRSIPKLVVPRIAEWCVVEVEALGPLTKPILELMASDPETEARLREVRERYPIAAPGVNLPTSKALRTGHAHFVPQVTPELLGRMARDPEHLAMLRRVAPISVMAVPLTVQGRVAGAISFGMSHGGRNFDPEDLRTAIELATTAGLALDNAQLYWHACHASDAREQVLNFVAHGLQSPLNAITEWGSRLLSVAPPSAELQHVAAAILDSADLLDRQVADLRDAVQIGTGRLTIHPESIRLEPSLAVSLEMAEPGAEHRGVTLRLDVEECGLVDADPQRIQQVLGNLLEHAIGCTPNGGMVTIHVRREQDVTVTVTGSAPSASHLECSSGCGEIVLMPEADLTLGLRAARGIVQAHGGRFRVEKCAACACKMVFTLPGALPQQLRRRNSGAFATPRAIELRPDAARDHGETRILLGVENAYLSSTLAAAITEDPASLLIGVASSADELRLLVQRHRPDAVIVDFEDATLRESLAHELASGGRAGRVIVIGTDDGVRGAAPTSSGAMLRHLGRSEATPATLLACARGDQLPAGVLPAAQAGRMPPAAPADARTIALLGELSDRERDVLLLTAKGFTAVETGDRLFLSPKTVETYRSRALRKLGLASRADLVAFALRSGLLSATGQL